MQRRSIYHSLLKIRLFKRQNYSERERERKKERQTDRQEGREEGERKKESLPSGSLK